MDLSVLPFVNAALNATSATLLIAGFLSIRTKHVNMHRWLMLGAFSVSVAFLVCYLIYHIQVGSVRFPGTGWIRPAYFLLLITHTVLAIAVVPLVLRSLFLAVRRRFEEHLTIARWTLPLWLYVSVSGVAVYWMLYRSHWGV